MIEIFDEHCGQKWKHARTKYSFTTWDDPLIVWAALFSFLPLYIGKYDLVVCVCVSTTVC